MLRTWIGSLSFVFFDLSLFKSRRSLDSKETARVLCGACICFCTNFFSSFLGANNVFSVGFRLEN